MYNYKTWVYCVLFLMMVTVIVPMPAAQAANADSILGALASSTLSDESTDSGGSGLIGQILDFLFNKMLGPIVNIFGGGGSANSSGSSPVKVIPLPDSQPNSGSGQDSGLLQGKVIVIDPGHGGSNPGAVANNIRETDNNLAVGLKLRDRLKRAGAKVIMTRDTDRNVAAEGSSLGSELQARVDIAEENQADIFVSIHSNSNPNTNIAGAMTFYHSAKTPALAKAVQRELIKKTGAVDKGVAPETFYVLRNTSMPGILVEMGFVTNKQEAAQLKSNAYRERVAEGIYNGVVNYFNSR
ncbi:hypothetical protein P22_2231 [Propionispora sp. 2/2-37]|uniref:N-acetylmuramoyl-L-alanine amidase family protein n=1 Tax=Propionispora sp. 2/2-37 TaxID=1677858 RepID=UPI0006C5B5EA|nr:N-acetylmuramoyl-L-alanine amidase [Propionispora sp. 2/2-37]CUH96143.1 hypothetical protein P22_2231 [Propionispora sp. 2/2-37]